MPPLTYQEVIGKQLPEDARNNYQSSIRQMRYKLTDVETLEYLDFRGLLVKDLNHDVATRILHACQIRNIAPMDRLMK